ncbi:hypothetical protein [Streptomyces sp. NPDC090132]|uniref:hypothetical protein n=1 Tax=Streptomyces sp. NPDC090132 TaxID=3365955 RepID=UPI00324C03D0
MDMLVTAAHAQLRLARTLVADRRRPREKVAAHNKLSPARFQRGFSNLHTTRCWRLIETDCLDSKRTGTNVRDYRSAPKRPQVIVHPLVAEPGPVDPTRLEYELVAMLTRCLRG